jgi:hypothetical protein
MGLFSQKWNSSDAEIRMQAVHSIHDISKLIKIKEKAKYDDVKLFCEEKITSIARNADVNERIIAISGLVDQELLYEIADSNDDLTVRIAAAKNITDKTKRELVLTKITADWKKEYLGLDIKKNEISRDKMDELKERTSEIVADHMKKHPNSTDISGIIQKEEAKITEEVEKQFNEEKSQLEKIRKELKSLFPQFENMNS